MILVIGSTPFADRLEQFLGSFGRSARVASPDGGSAEERMAGVRAALGSHGTPLMVVAATGEDERSLVAAAAARRFGARPVVAIVESPFLAAQARGFPDLGLDRVVEPDAEAAAMVTEHIIGPVAAAVHSLGQGQIRTTELVLSPTCEAVGRSLREHALPRGARIALVRRGEQGAHAIAPSASTVLEPGDRVLLVANRSVAADSVARFDGHAQAKTQVVVVGGPGVPSTRRDRFVHLLREADLDAVPADAPPKPDNRARHPVVVLIEPSDQQARDRGHVPIIAVGTGRPVDPVSAAARAIGSMLPRPPIEHVGALAPGVLEVYRVRAGVSGEWLGGPLRQTPGMRGWIVLATQSGEHAHLPHPEDAIEPGDVLIIAGPPGGEAVLARALAGTGKLAGGGLAPVLPVDQRRIEIG